MNMLAGLLAVAAARDLTQSALPDAPTVPGPGADRPHPRHPPRHGLRPALGGQPDRATAGLTPASGSTRGWPAVSVAAGQPARSPDRGRPPHVICR